MLFHTEILPSQNLVSLKIDVLQLLKARGALSKVLGMKILLNLVQETDVQFLVPYQVHLVPYQV